MTNKGTVVAGIGCRRGATTAAVVAAIHAAVARQGLGISSLGALATIALKQGEGGISAAGRALSLEVVIVDEASARDAAPRTLSRSEQSLAITGFGSASEAAALAAAGPDSRLLAPRVALGPVTCALAIAGGAQ